MNVSAFHGSLVRIPSEIGPYIPHLILLAVTGYILSSLYHAFLGPTSHIPGPFLARFTRLWELLEVSQGHFERTNVQLHKKYGPIVRIGPSKFSISDPAAVRALYAAGSKFPKSAFYFPFGDPHQANLFSEQSIQAHSQKRRRLAGAYSMSALVTYEESVDMCNATLCRRLAEFAETQTPINIPDWMQFYAFDVIGEITTSQSFGFMEQGWDFNTILQSIHETMVYGSRVGVFPELHSWIAWFGRITRKKIPFDVVQTYVDSQIAVRKGKEITGRQPDFLTKILALRRAGKATDVDLSQVIGQNIGAGSDTTSISLSSVIYGLCKNPEAERKLVDELESFAAAGNLSDPVTFEQSRQMPYLQACIKEGLRIHPAVGRPLLRVVPSGGTTLAGQYYPAGVAVGVNAWVLHRDESIFGPEPDKFLPERWLQDDAQKLARMEQNFLSFGAGSRTCIGKNISLLEMSKVIPQLYRKFEIRLADSGDMLTSEDWFVKQKFSCYIKLREST
ncbi:cytochrome P450 [Aspergillus ambiguus]|uniref:cytochrome P450 n=1 Tax=Aspergillus ambiguus TaxID=176160 RepID=UPI003CCD4A0F